MLFNTKINLNRFEFEKELMFLFSEKGIDKLYEWFVNPYSYSDSDFDDFETLIITREKIKNSYREFSSLKEWNEFFGMNLKRKEEIKNFTLEMILVDDKRFITPTTILI